MILWDTILIKLKEKINDDQISRFIDIRYLSKWINLYPECFPKFVINDNHKIIYDPEKIKYEFHKI